jgi:hypothetical protein
VTGPKGKDGGVAGCLLFLEGELAVGMGQGSRGRGKAEGDEYCWWLAAVADWGC